MLWQVLTVQAAGENLRLSTPGTWGCSQGTPNCLHRDAVDVTGVQCMHSLCDSSVEHPLPIYLVAPLLTGHRSSFSPHLCTSCSTKEEGERNNS